MKKLVISGSAKFEKEIKKWHKRICWSTSLCRNELYNSTKYITA